MTSYLNIQDADENDFGNYKCTIKCYITANGSKLDKINLCPQQRTIELLPDDYMKQAIRYKSHANMCKERLEGIHHSFNKFANVSKLVVSRIEECKTITGNLVLFIITLIEAIIVIVLIWCGIKYKHRKDREAAEYKENVKNVLRDLNRAVKETIPENPKGDIFLSHSTSDSDWVETSLLPFLEDRNYKVWFGDRDFSPGEIKVECTWKAINESKKTIVVLSPDFLNSRLCVGYELTLTLTKLLDANGSTDSLVILEYRPCDIPKILTGRMYLDFTDASAEKQSFEKLLTMLGQPIHRESE